MHLTYRWRATLVIAMASFTVLVYSITQAGTDGWGTPAVIGSLIVVQNPPMRSSPPVWP